MIHYMCWMFASVYTLRLHVLSIHHHFSSLIYYDNMPGGIGYSPSVDKLDWIHCAPASLGIIANMIVLIGMLGSRLWTSNQYLLIINLCICDLLLATSRLVMMIFDYLYVTYLKPEFLCLGYIMDRCYYTAQMSTVLTITTMTLDHYVAIILPLRYHVIFSRHRLVVCLITLWVMSTLFGFTRLAVSSVMSVNDGEPFTVFMLCYNKYIPRNLQYEFYCLWAPITTAIVIMVYVYIRVLIEIRKSAASMRHMIGPSQSCDHKMNHRAVITTLLILGTFIFGWVPYGICALPIRITNAHLGLVVNYLFMILPVVNTVCDPLIYSIRLIKVQQSIKKVFSCKQRDNVASGHWHNAESDIMLTNLPSTPKE